MHLIEEAPFKALNVALFCRMNVVEQQQEKSMMKQTIKMKYNTIKLFYVPGCLKGHL